MLRVPRLKRDFPVRFQPISALTSSRILGRLCVVPQLTTILAFVVLAWSGNIAYERFAPESSPIARGRVHAAKYPCSDKLCREQLNGNSHYCDLLATGTSCSDVAAYWFAAQLNVNIESRLDIAPANRLLRGESIARAHHCFRCHGELGQGGMANAGAFKEYIPGYFGQDFRDLTEGGRREVVQEWITTGNSSTLSGHPLTGFIANFYLRRQAISMPSFSSLTSDEIDKLVDYVLVLNVLGSLDFEGVQSYSALTALPPGSAELESLFHAAGKFSAALPQTER